MKERQGSTPISGPVLSIEAQKLHSSLHIDNPSAAEVASDLMSAMRWLETQATDPMQINQIHNLVQCAIKSTPGSLKQQKCAVHVNWKIKKLNICS